MQKVVMLSALSTVRAPFIYHRGVQEGMFVLFFCCFLTLGQQGGTKKPYAIIQINCDCFTQLLIHFVNNHCFFSVSPSVCNSVGWNGESAGDQGRCQVGGSV